MSTRTEILSLIAFLSAGLADQTECTRVYDEVMLELAHDPRAWCSAIGISSTGEIGDTSDDDQYELRSTVAKLLAVFYGGRQLSDERLCALNALPHWKDHTGEPWAFTREHESGRLLRLYPKPLMLPLNETLTTNTYSPTVLYTDLRTSGIPDVLTLPIALLIMAREFERESNHRDLNAAEIWRAMGTKILLMVQ